jgi:hypothetical protein
MSCLIRETLSSKAPQREIGAGFIVNAKGNAGILAEIKLSQIAVKVLCVDVLIDANQTALQDRKETFERVGVYVIPYPFELGMVHSVMAGNRGELVAGSGIGHEAAFVVHVLANDADSRLMVEEGRADIAATFHKAHDNRVVGLAAEASRPLGLAGSRQFGFISLNDLASAAKRANRAIGSHGKANAMAKMPSGFHAAAKDALKLAGRYAFLGRTKQVDGLKPQVQGQMAILKDRAHANRKRLAADVALAKASAGRLASQASNLGCISIAAMGARRSIRPKLGFDVFEGGFLVVKPISGKNRFGHGLSPMAKNLHMADGYVK